MNRLVVCLWAAAAALLLNACVGVSKIQLPPSWPAPQIEPDGRCLPFYVKVRDQFAERAAGTARLRVADSLFEELNRYATQGAGGSAAAAGNQLWRNTVELRLLDDRSLIAVLRDQAGAQRAQLRFERTTVACSEGGVMLERTDTAAVDGERPTIRQRMFIYPAAGGELLVKHRAIESGYGKRLVDGGTEVEDWQRFIRVP